MAGFFKTSLAVASGILMSIVALVALAAGSMLAYQGCINVPDYVLVADPGKDEVDARDADTGKPVKLDLLNAIDFDADGPDGDVIVRCEFGDMKGRRLLVPKRNLRSYATGKPLSP